MSNIFGTEGLPNLSPDPGKTPRKRRNPSYAQPPPKDDASLFKLLERETPDINDRPVISHPRNRHISVFAAELAHILKNHDFFQFHGRAAQVRPVTVKARNGKEHEIKQLVTLEASNFSTLIELYCQPVVQTRSGGLKDKSISLELASRTLVCLSFLRALPIVKLWTNVRLPVRIDEESIILSPLGYDPRSGVYTSPEAPPIDETMTIEEAVSLWRSLMAEFCFPKSGKTVEEEPDPKKREPEVERCIAVALAGAMTPFCLYILPEKAKRPGFAASANSEGAGKTLLLSFGMVALLGYVPTGSAPEEEEEMRKVLDATVDNGLTILFLDNLKHHISSGQLEAFITSTTRWFRRLGSTSYVEAENLSTVYLTANFATYSPDLRRRLLSIELILEEARAEERQIKNFLDEDKLVAMRGKLLSMLWTFVRHWFEKDQPAPDYLLPTFETWTQTVAGIIEEAGFVSPCQQSTRLRTGGDTVTQDMEKLVAEMVPKTEYRFSELVELARDHRLFAHLIPEEGDLEKDKSTRLALIFRKFLDRIFTLKEQEEGGAIHLRFCMSGETRRTQRFHARKP